MCSHRTAGRWGRRWDTFLILAVGGFAVLEWTALTTEGTSATLSAYLRRLAGLEPRCRHSHLGRGLILAVLLWAAGHLGFGLFGIGPRQDQRNEPA